MRGTDRGWLGGRGCFRSGAQEGFFGAMTFEQRPVGSEQIWGRDALAERNRSTGLWGHEQTEGAY